MICAYCGEDKKCTKEHIWPASIVREVGDRVRYNEKAKKFFWADLAIKDVCEKCNNVKLSALDKYGLGLYKTYFSKFYDGDEEVTFIYDFQRLAKWLLKLSFNAARASGSPDTGELALYANDIISGVDLEDNFSINVDLVKPVILSSSGDKTYPASNRLCRLQFQGLTDNGFILRIVAINSFYFWILIQNKPDSEVDLERVSSVIETVPGVYLNPNEIQISIKSSGVNLLQIHADWTNAMNSNPNITKRY